MTKDGWKWIGWMDTSILDQNGNVAAIIGVGRDIDDRKKAELEKESLQAQLIQSRKMESIGNLAGGIAHDFNNILASIIGFTELALDEAERGSTIEDSLQEVYTAGKRAKDLVKQILAFARQSEEERKPIQPGQIAKEVLKLLRSTIPVTVEINQSIDSESFVMGNPTQLNQVLMNLCTNAAHAMQESGGILEVTIKDIPVDQITDVEVKNTKNEDYLEIIVSDTGVGIAPNIIESIFEPYFTTKGPGEGTGMGLAVVQGIVETHGGLMHVESKIHEGSIFTLYFPITRKRREDHTYRPENLPTGVEKILFVDDEALIVKMGEQILSRLGYHVTSRTSSLEALELFRSKPDDFDLIVTDMTMPIMTGDQFATEVIAIRPDIPILLCTGYSNKMSAETAAAAGIRAFAYKPIVKADLAKTVRKVLDAGLSQV